MQRALWDGGVKSQQVEFIHLLKVLHGVWINRAHALTDDLAWIFSPGFAGGNGLEEEAVA